MRGLAQIASSAVPPQLNQWDEFLLQYSRSLSAMSDFGSQEACIFDKTDVNPYFGDYFSVIFTSDLEFEIYKTKLDRTVISVCVGAERVVTISGVLGIPLVNLIGL